MKATIDFYVDVLGMPLVHAMKVPPGFGTGPAIATPSVPCSIAPFVVTAERFREVEERLKSHRIDYIEPSRSFPDCSASIL